MNKTNYTDAALMGISLDKNRTQPLFDQLAQQLRRVILTGRLSAGAKLASTRKFAKELSVSRVTIVTAYDQLLAEGYLESKTGAGVFVVEDLPEELLQLETTKCLKAQTPPPANQSRPIKANQPMPFQAGNPDMRLFPHKDWARSFHKIWSDPQPDLLGNNDPMGYWPLRRQIADHLKVWRGVNCKPEHILMTCGAGEAVSTIIDALIQNGQSVAREEPGYAIFDRLLLQRQLKIAPIRVDENGLNVDQLEQSKPGPCCVIVTPSRQYPRGMTMPLSRRLQLLKWLEKGKRFLIEDDYDSEYRYSGTPLPALASLSAVSPVFYLGSFSKVFSKSLRLGYLVIPEIYLGKFEKALQLTQPGAAFMAQPVLARFMQTGAYASHIRRMRRIYATRQKFFVEIAEQNLKGLIAFSAESGGMNLVGKIGHKLDQRLSDVQIAEIAAKAGVLLVPLSSFYASQKTQQGLIAGYAGFDEGEILTAVKSLAGSLVPYC